MKKTARSSSASKKREDKLKEPRRDIELDGPDAQAGAPSDSSVLGEEDPGAGLEFLVRRDRPKQDRHDD